MISSKIGRAAHTPQFPWATLLAVAGLLWILVTTSALAGKSGADVVERARKSCFDIENGNLKVTDMAIARVDLNGDGHPDEIVDSCKLSCSTAPGLFQWPGGCLVSAVVDNKVSEFVAKDWKVVGWGSQPVLLLSINGAECGNSKLATCIRSLVWSDGQFHSPTKGPR